MDPTTPADSAPTRRFATVNRGLATAAITLLLAPLVAGCSLLPGQATPSASSGPEPLAPGTYTTKSFQPAVTFTVPAGWTNPTDTAAYFNLMPTLDDANGVHLFHNPQALSQAANCPASAQPGVGSSSVAMIAWIRSLKGFSVTQPALATVGGLPATAIDIAIASSWTQSCPFANGLPAVPLFYDAATSLRWVVAGDERLRLYFVDVPGSGTVVVDLDSFDGAGYSSLLANAAPIVKSLSFASQ
jgi:hypothetical protein